MEYNKNLYFSLKKIVDQCQQMQEKIEKNTNLSFNEIKEINIQLKHHQQVCEKFKEYNRLINNAKEIEHVLVKQNINDEEFLMLAKNDLESIKKTIPPFELQLKKLLLPIDPNDDKNVIMEMRAAAGGEESSIFVADLFDTYKKYFDRQGWQVTIIDISPQPHGYSYLSFIVKGKNVYRKMKFESGVHRVQRVPLTESKGRIHTSTITVAVLPQIDKIDFKINPSDLRIDVYRASGAGGQHVNRTESAVRITHLPTGVVASCQEGKSQIQNRETAMNMLKAKICQQLKQQQKNKLDLQRKNQVGTGERSEKIRTYNYPQNRITDHRIGLTLNKLDIIMASGNLNEMIDQLIADEQAKSLANLKI